MTKHPKNERPVDPIKARRAALEAQIDADAAREGDAMGRGRRPQNIRTVLTAQGQ